MSSSTPVRVAIVTGAAQGIGRAIALRLADDGLDVAVNDIKESDLIDSLVDEIKAKGRKAVAVVGDVSKEEDVQAIVNTTVSELGQVDVMVANAGIGKPTPLLTATLDEWARVWDINARGVFLCYSVAAKQMVKQGTGGRIIGMSSVCGKKGFAGLGAYCSTKFAVRGLTQNAAVELREYGIQVNAIAPGVIDTPMAGPPGMAAARLKEFMKVPHAKTGQPEDIASMVSYLASPESYFVTGQTISVDGGLYFS